MVNSTPPHSDRKVWISLLAKASSSHLSELWATYDEPPEHSVLRAPEVGSVMVRGRTGATGAAFNLGEMTVTRCSVQLASGETGHGYIQGRDKKKALQAAMIDALLQTAAAPQVQRKIVDPLQARHEEKRARRSAKAAATKVDFFTMVRGEDT
ncbi:phosphonate C-P lyase system protein PhnG [uncultured Roseobacter sp.]|uniref:phosphonate C-P lyase system protein PhnG n=1 Tax=uncultured Roseobacter sp. TaxID=114847 RepID=UPI00260344B9|nr:phosphonate C-P lyase system protein PhnG [uncultured Roseobacter sp.]